MRPPPSQWRRGSLPEVRADAERAREREAKASEELDIAASRAAGNPVADELRKDGVISAAERQDALIFNRRKLRG